MPAPTKPLDRILISLKLKQAEGALTRDQAMRAWPVRNPALKSNVSEDGLVTIELPRRKDWMGGLLGMLFSVPASKPVQLDEIGSFVYDRCEGDHTVNDIVDAMMSEYKLNRREVEVSLTKFLQMLAQRGIIAFAVPREIAEAAGLTGEHYGAGTSEEPAPAAAPEDDAPALALASEAEPAPTEDVTPAEAAPEPAPEPTTTDAPAPEAQDDQEHPGGV